MARYARLEEWLIILIGGAVTIVVALYGQLWALVPGLLTLALLSFYRDPPRRVPQGERLILSPADGRIMAIDPEYRATPDSAVELRIVIFLSVFNVHVNRTPCAGAVTATEYTPGKFLNALKPEATALNENTLVTIDPAEPLPGPIHVRQISGLLAKRIVCELDLRQQVRAGERYGMIKLGSQTEIRLPADSRWTLGVKTGDSVKGGLTVLATLAETA